MRAFLLGCGLILATISLNASTIHVPADQPTIQAGIDSASNGDTVLVADGTYTGDGNRDIDFTGKNIVLRSENGASVTIIDCQGTESEPHRGFYLHSGEDTLSVITGFTIMNGYITGYSSGGAILVTYAASSPIIRDCNFIGNYAGDYGGAIFTWHYLNLDNCNFIDNSTRFAAGAVAAGKLNIRNCIFTGNQVETGGWSGGAVVASNDNLGIHSISNCWFEQNSATYGGAVFVYPNASCRIDSSIFVANTGMFGGAVWFDTVCCDPTTHVISHCTFVNNTAEYGSGICFVGYYYPVATVENCIVAFSLGGEPISCYYPGVDPDVICTNIFGNAGGDWVGCIADQADSNGNFSINPMFCDTAAGDYRIHEDSPCAPTNNTCGVLIGALPIGCSCCILRGDVNGDGQLDVADITYKVDWLFKGGPPPPCIDHADDNGDGSVDVADLMYEIGYYFLGGPPPVPCP